ncbi:hypothetical protein WA538_003339 [Blastocystis sp. DL]
MAQREIEESEAVINRYFERINENTSRQDEIQRVLSELELIGEGEKLVSLIGPVLLEEKKENARANLKDQLATLKDEEKELRSQVDSERRRHDRLVEEKSWVVC